MIFVQIAEAVLVGFNAELKFNFAIRTALENVCPAASRHVAIHIETTVARFTRPNLVDAVLTMAGSEVVRAVGVDFFNF